MIFLKRDSLETLIIKALQNEGSSGPSIISYIKKQKPNITDQAIYVVLRRLIKDDILYKRASVYSLNRLWLKELYSFAGTQLDDMQKKETAAVIDMEDGDKITYQFRNPHLMDIYWEHLFDTLLETHNPKIPAIIYHPHNWFIHSRPESEQFFLKQFKKKQLLALFAVGGKSKLDLSFKETWQNDYLRINCGNDYKFEDGYYLNILDDIILEVFIDHKFNKEIQKMYTLSETDPTFQQFMKSVSLKRYATKLVITKNRKRAHQLSKRVAKDFFLPKDYILSSNE
jgi:DNA-binding PadR family transcriptional regulator